MKTSAKPARDDDGNRHQGPGDVGRLAAGWSAPRRTSQRPGPGPPGHGSCDGHRHFDKRPRTGNAHLVPGTGDIPASAPPTLHPRGFPRTGLAWTAWATLLAPSATVPVWVGGHGLLSLSPPLSGGGTAVPSVAAASLPAPLGPVQGVPPDFSVPLRQPLARFHVLPGRPAWIRRAMAQSRREDSINSTRNLLPARPRKISGCSLPRRSCPEDGPLDRLGQGDGGGAGAAGRRSSGCFPWRGPVAAAAAALNLVTGVLPLGFRGRHQRRPSGGRRGGREGALGRGPARGRAGGSRAAAAGCPLAVPGRVHRADQPHGWTWGMRPQAHAGRPLRGPCRPAGAAGSPGQDGRRPPRPNGVLRHAGSRRRGADHAGHPVRAARRGRGAHRGGARPGSRAGDRRGGADRPVRGAGHPGPVLDAAEPLSGGPAQGALHPRRRQLARRRQGDPGAGNPAVVWRERGEAGPPVPTCALLWRARRRIRLGPVTVYSLVVLAGTTAVLVDAGRHRPYGKAPSTTGG